MTYYHQKAKNKKLWVIGVHTASEAYPNTLHTLEAIRRDFCPSEINIPLLPKTGGAINLRNSRVGSTLKFIVAHTIVLLRALHANQQHLVYVPYPSTFLLLAWSFFPKRFRPRKIIADAFISIYDTVVNDRKLLNPKSYFSKILKIAERRAFRTADTIIVDTPQNADFYAKLFQLPRRLFTPIPLLTNEESYFSVPLPSQRVCNVLFIGTLIPLHGIDVILSAARLLADRKDIVFTIVGDGQEAHVVENSINSGDSNLIWDRKWSSTERLANYIAKSSICLGIFGITAKTDRVCPYKVYAYASVGRPVITANSSWLTQAEKEYGRPPFIGTPPGDPVMLAQSIVSLADNKQKREQMSEAANRFYAKYLSNSVAYSRFRTCLLENGET